MTTEIWLAIGLVCGLVLTAVYVYKPSYEPLMNSFACVAMVMLCTVLGVISAFVLLVSLFSRLHLHIDNQRNARRFYKSKYD